MTEPIDTPARCVVGDAAADDDGGCVAGRLCGGVGGGVSVGVAVLVVVLVLVLVLPVG